MRNILDNLENAAAKLQDMGEKVLDNAKAAIDKTGDSIERAMDEAKDALERALDSLTVESEIPTVSVEEAPEKRLTFEEKLDQEVSSQVDAIRVSQQTPGAFSDYIAKKFGKDK